MKLRGYTLAEFTVVLIVVMFIATFAGAAFFNIEKGARNKEAARQLSQIKTAIVNYAAANATSQRFVEVANLSITTSATTTVVVRHRIPAGRPYLPCPDITGDGREDRIAPADATEVVSLTLTLSVAYAGMDYPLESTGGCVSSRGIVPWRTLNTPVKDPWGNRYSYRVAGIYSNAQTGFDQYATGDARYAARPLVPLAGGNALAATLSLSVFSTMSLAVPGWNSSEFRNYLAPSVVCISSPCLPGISTVSVAPVAGERLTAILPLTITQSAADFGVVVERRLTTGDLISGVPFVVLSHGENGYGGVRADVGRYICNPFPPEPAPDPSDPSPSLLGDEMQNAAWFVTAVYAPGGDTTYDCGNPPPPMMGDSAGFIAGVNSGYRTFGVRGEYDDVVDWMSAPELVGALTDLGALPARPPPPIGLEQ